jgi:hypothetical protein
MTLENLLRIGKLKAHAADEAEIARVLESAERALKDAAHIMPSRTLPEPIDGSGGASRYQRSDRGRLTFIAGMKLEYDGSAIAARRRRHP